jgi:hypothetical protein
MVILLYLHARIGLASVGLEPRGLPIILGMMNVIIIFPLTTVVIMLNYNVWDIMGRGLTVVHNLSFDEDDERPRWTVKNCMVRLRGRTIKSYAEYIDR